MEKFKVLILPFFTPFPQPSMDDTDDMIDLVSISANFTPSNPVETANSDVFYFWIVSFLQNPSFRAKNSILWRSWNVFLLLNEIHGPRIAFSSATHSFKISEQ